MEDGQEEREREWETRRLKRGRRQGAEVRQQRSPGGGGQKQLKRAVKFNR